MRLFTRMPRKSYCDGTGHFPDADHYKSLLIFNIRHNYYRLIVKVDYRAKLLMVKEFLTHQEYMRGGWKKWAR
jgi:mRNA interferase HigB